jgi:hypothetical protein
MIFRVCRDPRAAGGDDRVRPAPIQPERASGAKQNRAKPNKTKQNCFDLLILFTFIFFIHVYFLETSYFNELQAIQTKNFLLLLHARSGCEYGRVARSRLRRTQPRRSARVKFVIAENYSRIFGFAQENVEIILNSRSPSRRSRAGKLFKTELRQRFHGHMEVKA